MDSILHAFSSDRDVQMVLEGLQSGMKEQMVSGLAGSSRPVALAAMYKKSGRPFLVVTHNMFSAQKIAEDLVECLTPEDVLLYPANELTAMESAAASPEIMAQRIDVMTRLAKGFKGITVVPYAGIRKLLPTKEVYKNLSFSVHEGDELPLEQFIERIHLLGYERVERVEHKGQFSVRGGICDLYPMTEGESGYRIEWFDDEIESIRTFDIETQRSKDAVQQIDIVSGKEFIAERERFQSAAQSAAELLQKQLDKMSDSRVKGLLEENIRSEIEQLRLGEWFPNVYKYIGLLYPERETLLDYVEEDAVLFLDEPMRLLEVAKQMEKDEVEWTTLRIQEGREVPGMDTAVTYDALFQEKRHQTIYLTLFLRQVPNTQPENIVNLVSRTMQNFHGQMHVLKSEMERWEKSGMNVKVIANGKERLDRIRRIFSDYKIKEPAMVSVSLQSGFEFPSAQLVVITEGELFHKKQQKARRTGHKIENAERIKSYQELKPGDYVVHVNHGIGRYEGIGTLEMGGIHRDYMHIIYANGDKLSVPIDQIELVQKYIGAEEKAPKLNKLGGTDWAKAKTKTRSSVKDIADELVKLYAARQATKGYAFSKDTSYQKEFEAMFPYEETPDQLRAIEEVKRDMEQSHPMDRLLCGDVGYGKTEVAIRAAFKAVMDGKQVAVLVPTTILAQQHFLTFQERFADYPVTIRALSRFQSKKDQTETIKGLADGTVDIVVGTHRLLSKTVRFKDLGLLVVDEEQRFGVSHKEKLKQIKTNVDVLTLTATPIPRTLHMSMIGVRDLSVIETPPENRFPVQTYVVEHTPGLVREAIEREMSRNGQIYYLYNRVQGIYKIADQLSALVPEARIAVCHGQMSEQELESTILDFLDGEYDVLVSTTIIETGVDIPNVNTLIVHDADKMGLSQLYQLRGRIGRSNRIAYAYLTYQKDKVLTEVAEKRLQSIREFTELGSGFKIAMRDLAIRGAGNLLGAEQSGFIASVGYDLYSKMLAEEIEKRRLELNGETEQEQVEEWSTRFDVEIDAYIPPDYIYDNVQKIEIYKKVAAIREYSEAEELAAELKDRFGTPPQAVENLLLVARLKTLGKHFKISSISLKNHDLYVLFDESMVKKCDVNQLVRLANRFEGRIKLIPGSQLQLAVKGRGLKLEQAMALLEQFLKQLSDSNHYEEGELQHAAK